MVLIQCVIVVWKKVASGPVPGRAGGAANAIKTSCSTIWRGEAAAGFTKKKSEPARDIGFDGCSVSLCVLIAVSVSLRLRR